MSFYWPNLAPALVLLLVPIGLFHGRTVRFRAISTDWQPVRNKVFALPHHTIDLLRAVVGAWLLAHSIGPDANPVGLAKHFPMLITTGVVVAAVLLQTLVCREPDSINAPFTFVTGLLLGMAPPMIAGLALICVLTLTIGTRIPAVYFMTLPLGIAGAGVVFMDPELLPSLAPLCIAPGLPWLLALMLSRELVLSYRIRLAGDPRSSPQEPDPR